MAREITPLDKAIGARVRARRLALGVRQEALAERLNLAPQQLQKYETGVNRISASRLYEISQWLETPISFFFEDTKAAAE